MQGRVVLELFLKVPGNLFAEGLGSLHLFLGIEPIEGPQEFILATFRLCSEAIFLTVVTEYVKATRGWHSEQNLNFSVEACAQLLA